MLSTNHGWNMSFKPLYVGLFLSLMFILGIYFIVTEQLINGMGMLFAVLGFATLQALVQCVLFLHVGVEAKPHWNLIFFFLMILILVIVVGGSIWIMVNLNYNMM